MFRWSLGGPREFGTTCNLPGDSYVVPFWVVCFIPRKNTGLES